MVIVFGADEIIKMSKKTTSKAKNTRPSVSQFSP